MRIDGYEIDKNMYVSATDHATITYFIPYELDKGILDQLHANAFGYVDDDILFFDSIFYKEELK